MFVVSGVRVLVVSVRKRRGSSRREKLAEASLLCVGAPG